MRNTLRTRAALLGVLVVLLVSALTALCGAAPPYYGPTHTTSHEGQSRVHQANGAAAMARAVSVLRHSSLRHSTTDTTYGYCSASYGYGVMAGSPFPGGGSNMQYQVSVIDVRYGYVQADLAAAQNVLPITALSGPQFTTLNTYGALVVDPIPGYPGICKRVAGHLYLAPTLEQELSVLARFYATYVHNYTNITERLKAYAVVRDAKIVGESVVESAVKAAFLNEGVSLEKTTVVSPFNDLIGQLPDAGVVVVAGLKATEVVLLVDAMKFRSLRVLMSFDDVTKYYDILEKVFQKDGGELRSNLFFATSFPHWKPLADGAIVTRGADLLQSFLGNVTNPELHNPAAFHGFMVNQVLYDLSQGAAGVTGADLRDVAYRRVTFSVGGMDFGPYSLTGGTSSIGDTRAADPVNYGAQDVAVWNFRRAMDTTERPLMDDLLGETTSTTTTTKIPPPQDSDSSAKGDAGTNTTAVVAGAVVGGVVVAAVIALLVLWCCGCLACCGPLSRARAPKSSTVTMVVTSVEGSAELWEMEPEIVSAAMQLHDEIMRELIARHRCEEVSVDADAFTILCRDAHCAVQLARDVQREMLQCEWNDDGALDAAYAKLSGCASKPSAGGNPYGTSAAWRGLRVRVGVHTGEADVPCDKATGRVDILGDVLRVASALEGACAGGQVLLTAATYDALGDADVSHFDMEALSARLLSGLRERVDLYQLNCVAGREFPALLDRKASVVSRRSKLGDGVSRGVLCEDTESQRNSSVYSRSVSAVGSGYAAVPQFAGARAPGLSRRVSIVSEREMMVAGDGDVDAVTPFRDDGSMAPLGGLGGSQRSQMLWEDLDI